MKHCHVSSWRCGIMMAVLVVLLPTGCIGWSILRHLYPKQHQQQMNKHHFACSVFLATCLVSTSFPSQSSLALEPMSSQQASVMHAVQQQPSSSVALAADRDENNNKWSSDSLFPTSKISTIIQKENNDNVPSTTSRRRNIKLPRSALDPSKMNPQRVTGLVYLTQDKEDSQILQQQMLAKDQQEEEETTTNYQITLTVATMDDNNPRILAGVKVPLSAIGSFPFRFDLGIEHIKSGVSVQDFQSALNQNDLLVQAAICPANTNAAGSICTPATPNSVWAGEGISKYLPDISGLMMDDDKNSNAPKEKIALRAGASVPLERNKDLLLSKEK